MKLKKRKLNQESQSSKANKENNQFDSKVKNKANKTEVKHLEVSSKQTKEYKPKVKAPETTPEIKIKENEAEESKLVAVNETYSSYEIYHILVKRHQLSHLSLLAR